MSIAPSVGTRDDSLKGKWNHWMKWDLEHEVPGGKKGHAWGEAGAAAEHAKPAHRQLPLPKVGKVWGKDRTAEYMGRDLHAEGEWHTDPAKARYGTIIFNHEGKLLLREPKGHFSGMVWTFPKGHPDPGEHPVETARRETLEETGLNPAIVGHLRPTYTGSTGEDHFYLAHVDSSQHPEFLNGETDRLTWASPAEAEQLLKMSTNSIARERDLWALHDAVSAHAALYPKVSTPMEPRTMLTVAPTVTRPAPPTKSDIIGGHITKAISEGFNYDGIRAQAKAKGLAGSYGEAKANRDALRSHLDAAIKAETTDSRDVALAHAAAKGFDDAVQEHPDKPKYQGGYGPSSGHWLHGSSSTLGDASISKAWPTQAGWANNGGGGRSVADEVLRPTESVIAVLVSVAGTRDWATWDAAHPYQDIGGKGVAWAAAGAAARRGTGKGKPVGPRQSRWTAEDHEVVRSAKARAKAMPKGKRFTGDRAMTPDEFKAHRANTERQLAEHGVDDLMRSPFSTHNSEDKLGGIEGVYHPDRTAQHRQIIDEIMANASEVPNDRQALVTAGLGGAGKSTTLRKGAAHEGSVAHKMGIKYGSYDEHGNGVGEPTNFITLNPDDIKEKMAARGMIPEIGNLSPMERSTFVHEEASHITHQLGQRAMAEGKNIIHDITLNSVKSGEVRLQPLRDRGYSVGGVMVDVSPEHSAQNAESRHLHGQDRFNRGEGHGGRYVPTHLILNARDETGQYRSKNRAAFEEMKRRGMYDRTVTVDNEGNAGRVIDESGTRSWDRYDAERGLKPHKPIRQLIDQYHAGEMPWAELLDHLASYDYKTPSHHKAMATEDDIDEADRDEAGTFHEVTTAHAEGRLTDHEYDTVVRAVSPELPDAPDPILDSHLESPSGTTGARADAPMFSANGKLNGWWKWDMEHPGLGQAGHVAHVGSGSGAAWGHGWGEGAKEYWAEHATNKLVSDSQKKGVAALPEGHFDHYKAGFKVGLSAGVKLGGDSDVPAQDSKQISDRAAPLYAAAKKAKDQGNLEEHAKLLGAAHGFKEASKAKASWEKANGVTPHEDAPKKGVKVAASVASIASNASEAAPAAPAQPKSLAEHMKSAAEQGVDWKGIHDQAKADWAGSNKGGLYHAHADLSETLKHHLANPEAKSSVVTGLHATVTAMGELLHEAEAAPAPAPAPSPATVASTSKKLAGWSKWNEERPSASNSTLESHSKAQAKAAVAKLPAELKQQVTDGHGNWSMESDYIAGHQVGHEAGTKMGRPEHGGLDSKQISDKAAPLYAEAKKAKDAGLYSAHAKLLGAAHGFKLASKEKAAWEKANGVTPHTDTPGGKGKKVGASVAAVPNPSAAAAEAPAEPKLLSLEEHIAKAHQEGTHDWNADYDHTHGGALESLENGAHPKQFIDAVAALDKGLKEHLAKPDADSHTISALSAAREGFADALKAHGEDVGPFVPEPHESSPEDDHEIQAMVAAIGKPDVPHETSPHAPSGPSNPYPEGSFKGSLWQRAHDEALQHAQSVSMQPTVAHNYAAQHEDLAKVAPGSTTKASMEGAAAGYAHHAANLEAPKPVGPDTWVTDLKAGDTLPSGHHIQGVELSTGQTTANFTVKGPEGKVTQTHMNLMMGHTAADLIAKHDAKAAQKVTPSVATHKTPSDILTNGEVGDLHAGDKMPSGHMIGGVKELLNGNREVTVVSPNGDTTVHSKPPHYPVSALLEDHNDKLAQKAEVPGPVGPSGLSDNMTVGDLKPGDTTPSGHMIGNIQKGAINHAVTVTSPNGESTIQQIHPSHPVNTLIAAHEGELAADKAAGLAPGGVEPPKTEADLAQLTKKSPGETFSFGEKVPKAGTNGGQWYEDSAGHAYFLKGAQSDEHAMNEVAGSLAYQHAGVAAQKVSLVKMNNGSVRALSHYIPGLTPILSAADTNQQTRATARAGAGMDALMSHYDLTGLVTPSGKVDGPNLFKDKQGNVVRLDLGGTGKFRAQGGLKPTWKVDSWDNPGSMGPDYESIRAGDQGKLAYGETNPGIGNMPASMKESMAKAATLDLAKYHQAMLDAGISKEFADQQAKVMAARQNHLLANLPEAAQMHGAKAAEPAPAAPAAAGTAGEASHDVFGVPVTPSEAKKALDLYESAPGEPAQPGYYKPGAGAILDALAVTQHGAPNGSMAYPGKPIIGTSYTDIYTKLKEIAGGETPAPAAGLGAALQAAAAKEGVAPPRASSSGQVPVIPHLTTSTLIPAHAAHPGDVLIGAVHSNGKFIPGHGKVGSINYSAGIHTQNGKWKVLRVSDATEPGAKFKSVKIKLAELDANDQETGKTMVSTHAAHSYTYRLKHKGKGETKWQHYQGDNFKPIPPDAPFPRGTGVGAEPPAAVEATATGPKKKLASVMAKNLKAGDKFFIPGSANDNPIEVTGAHGFYGAYGGDGVMVKSNNSAGQVFYPLAAESKVQRLTPAHPKYSSEPFALSGPEPTAAAPAVSPSVATALPTVSASEAMTPSVVAPKVSMPKATTTSSKVNPKAKAAPLPHHEAEYHHAFDMAAQSDGSNVTQAMVNEAQVAFQVAPPGSAEEAQLKGIYDGLQQAVHAWEKSHVDSLQAKQDAEYVTNVGKQYMGQVAFKPSTESAPVPGQIPHGTKPHYATEQSSKAYDLAIAQGYDQAVAAFKAGEATPEQIQAALPLYLKRADEMGTPTNDKELIDQAHLKGLAQGAGKAAVDLKAGNDFSNASSKSLIQNYKAKPQGVGAQMSSFVGAYGGGGGSSTQTKHNLGHAFTSAVSKWKGEYVYSNPGPVCHALKKINKGQDPGSGEGAEKAKTIVDAYVNHGQPSKYGFQRKITTHGGTAPWSQKYQQVGSLVDIPLTSWSTDPAKWAGDMWLHVPVGTKTLDIGQTGGLGHEAETITGGRFMVKEVKKQGGTIHVYLSQVEPYKPGKGTYSTTPEAAFNVGGKLMTDAELQEWLDTLATDHGAKK